MINRYEINHPKLWAEYLSSLYNKNTEKDLLKSHLFDKQEKKCLQYFFLEKRWSILLFIMNNYFHDIMISKAQLHRDTGVSRATIHRVCTDCIEERWLHYNESPRSFGVQEFQPSCMLVNLWCKYTEYRCEHITKYKINQSITTVIWNKEKEHEDVSS